MTKSEHWGSRFSFIMAAMGAAIGLGNLWRFSFVAAKNGGGAFLLPYFIALITAGIPLVIIEYGLGNMFQCSAHGAMGKINKFFKFIGWSAIIGSFIVCVYYCVVMAWSLYYFLDSDDVVTWGATMATSQHKFFQDVLNVSGSPWEFGGIQWWLYGCLAIIWIVIAFIIHKGVKFIGKVILFTVPLPVVFVFILLIRGLTLDGAAEGISFYLIPSWEALLNPNVWLAAYGQIFFSLSVGLGTLIAYASFMPKKSEVPNSAMITAFANCSFSYLVGFSVFSILGYYAFSSGETVAQVAQAGPGLAFVAFPTAIAELPFAQQFFSYLFYAILLLLGIDSAFSLLETIVAGFVDAFGFSKGKTVWLLSLLGLVLGAPFVTRAGLYWLDIVDHFLLEYLLVFIGLMECIAVGYFMRNTFIREINENAEIKLGPLFKLFVMVISPLILTIVFVSSLIKEFTGDYGGYPMSANMILGLGSLVLTLLVAVILSSKKVQGRNGGIS